MKMHAKLHANLRAFGAVLALAGCIAPAPARAAGTTPLALNVQFDLTGGIMPGCLLYFYQAGTVATPQQVYQDFGLTQPAPNPMQCDAGARVPQHWLADGLIHIRLTDASGVVVVDTTTQVLGPSSGGGGGGGGGFDPSAVAATGDIKAKLSSETLVGWVVLNGTTIGSAASGATQRANADTQNLFSYLWQNCTNAHCPVSGGRGASAISDFSANKQITLPDMRAKALVGRDCMGTGCAGVLQATNITSGGGDGPDTVGASGGQPNQTAKTGIARSNLPSGLTFNLTGQGSLAAGAWSHSHTPGSAGTNFAVIAGGGTSLATGTGLTFAAVASTTTVSNPRLDIDPGSFATSCSDCAGTVATSQSFATMPPFLLGTWFMKL